MATVIFPLIVSGLAVGSIYALIAFGFVLLLKATNTLSFAQLSFITLGAFVAFTLITTASMPFVPAVLISGLVSFTLGVLLYFLVVKPMEGQPDFVIVVATIGVSFMIRPVIGYFWGYSDLYLPTPFGDEPISLGFGISVSSIHLAILATVLVLIFIFVFFFNNTLFGTQMRAVANDTEAAHMMGINVKKVYIISWGVAALSAAIGGVFLAGMQTVNVNLGDIALKAFPVLILGGIESIPGVIIAGLFIGVFEVIFGYYFGPQISTAMVFVLLLLVLMFKPYGLFGERTVQRV